MFAPRNQPSRCFHRWGDWVHTRTSRLSLRPYCHSPLFVVNFVGVRNFWRNFDEVGDEGFKSLGQARPALFLIHPFAREVLAVPGPLVSLALTVRMDAAI